MDSFKAYNPTCLFFGNDVISKIGQKAGEFGTKALIMYGKGSVLKNGIYDAVAASLAAAGIETHAYGGIKSNPLYTDVDNAATQAKAFGASCIIAIGGGSVIDSAKITAITAPATHSSWDFMTGKATPRTALPLISVLTLAATGSEMNQFAVLQNDETLQKLGYGHPLIYPKYSFLNPAYTCTVPADYTAYGLVDIIAHSLEAFFGKGTCDLSDRVAASIISEIIEKGENLMSDLSNYALRADVMLASTLALNGTTVYGKSHGDWGVHGIGHELSVLYDVPHGASLSVVYPAWLKAHVNKAQPQIEKLGRLVFGVNDAFEAINSLENFFSRIGAPVRLSQIVPEAKKQDVLDQLIRHNVSGGAYKLSVSDYEKIVADI